MPDLYNDRDEYQQERYHVFQEGEANLVTLEWQ